MAELKLDLLASLGCMWMWLLPLPKWIFHYLQFFTILVPYTKFKTNVFYVIPMHPFLCITFSCWKAHFSKSSSTVSCDVISVPSNRINHSFLCVIYVPSTLITALAIPYCNDLFVSLYFLPNNQCLDNRLHSLFICAFSSTVFQHIIGARVI